MPDPVEDRPVEEPRPAADRRARGRPLAGRAEAVEDPLRGDRPHLGVDLAHLPRPRALHELLVGAGPLLDPFEERGEHVAELLGAGLRVVHGGAPLQLQRPLGDPRHRQLVVAEAAEEVLRLLEQLRAALVGG